MTRPTQILLIRHAHSTANLKSILAGRDKSVGLSDRGRSESISLANYLTRLHTGGSPIHKIVSSPLLRARETIAPFLLQNPGIPSLRNSALIEMDYGSWSGKKLSTLAKKPLWQEIQSNPSTVRFPDGESFLEMASRSSEVIRRESLPGKTTVFISHGDVIKAIIANFLGMHLDQFQRLVIEPASISSISLRAGSPLIHFMNSTAHLSQIFNHEVDSTLGGGSGSVEKTNSKPRRGKRS